MNANKADVSQALKTSSGEETASRNFG